MAVASSAIDRARAHTLRLQIEHGRFVVPFRRLLRIADAFAISAGMWRQDDLSAMCSGGCHAMSVEVWKTLLRIPQQLVMCT